MGQHAHGLGDGPVVEGEGADLEGVSVRQHVEHVREVRVESGHLEVPLGVGHPGQHARRPDRRPLQRAPLVVAHQTAHEASSVESHLDVVVAGQQGP